MASVGNNKMDDIEGNNTNDGLQVLGDAIELAHGYVAGDSANGNTTEMARNTREEVEGNAEFTPACPTVNNVLQGDETSSMTESMKSGISEIHGALEGFADTVFNENMSTDDTINKLLSSEQHYNYATEGLARKGLGLGLKLKFQIPKKYRKENGSTKASDRTLHSNNSDDESWPPKVDGSDKLPFLFDANDDEGNNKEDEKDDDDNPNNDEERTYNIDKTSKNRDNNDVEEEEHETSSNEDNVTDDDDKNDVDNSGNEESNRKKNSNTIDGTDGSDESDNSDEIDWRDKSKESDKSEEGEENENSNNSDKSSDVANESDKTSKEEEKSRDILRRAIAVGVYNSNSTNPHAFRVLVGDGKHITPIVDEQLKKWKPEIGFKVSFL